MSPIDKIKEAFLQQDWSIIQEAYEQLTGQELTNIVENKTKAKKSKVRGKKSNEVLVDPVPEVLESIPVERDQESFTSIKNGKRQEPVKVLKDGVERTMCVTEQIDLSKSKINLFYDDLSMENQLVGKANKPVSKVKQTTRPGYQNNLVEVQCKSCDRFFKVQKEFSSHFRCEGCMVRR